MRCVCQTGIGYWSQAIVRRLTEEEELEVAEHALAKSLASRGRYRTRPRTDSVVEKTMAKHREADLRGARGEKAWSVFWGVEWPKTIDDFKDPDFPPDIEIRTTRMDPPWLVLRERDMSPFKRDRRFVLLSEKSDGHLVIHGWVRPREVAHEFEPRLPYPGAPGSPARFIPLSSLHRLPFYSGTPKKHAEQGPKPAGQGPKPAGQGPKPAERVLKPRG